MKRKATSSTAGAEEARKHLPAILNSAIAGRSTVITRHGRKVAAVVPVNAIRPPRPASLTALAGTGRNLWGARSAQTIARLRNEWSR